MPDPADKSFWTIDRVRVDGYGVHALDEGVPSIRWSDVRRVALGYEIHPFVTADFEFWAFQLNDPLTLYRVTTTLDDELTAEVYRRFRTGEIPPRKRWPHFGRALATCVIWPAADAGKSLYEKRKRHWWSWSSDIDHALP